MIARVYCLLTRTHEWDNAAAPAQRCRICKRPRPIIVPPHLFANSPVLTLGLQNSPRSASMRVQPRARSALTCPSRPGS